MFTWNEKVSLFLVLNIGLPSDLVIEMMKKHIGPKRRKFVEDESREWHNSLRITPYERCHMVYNPELYGFCPCGSDHITVPFDFNTSKISMRVIESINLFRDDFIKWRTIVTDELGNMIKEDVRAKINEKIHVVNTLFKICIFTGRESTYYNLDIEDYYLSYLEWIEGKCPWYASRPPEEHPYICFTGEFPLDDHKNIILM
jgi:hypothetical protein